MKSQIKKTLLTFILACYTSTCCTCISYANVNQAKESEVVEQESIITEPAIIPPLELEKEDKVNNETTIVVEVAYIQKWTTASVNVREAPSLDSEILETYKYNTLVSSIEEKDGWTQIKYKDSIAYIKSDYLTENKQESQSPYANLISNFTEYEKYLIYQITYAEAGNQTMQGQRAVIEVILNRVLSNKYPNSVEGVLSQRGQFVTWKLRDKVRYNSQQVEALNLVATQAPVLNLNYLMFSLGKNSWGKNYIKIDSQWFGTF